ncbi:unnamed protein product [Closterium sp. NIES-54]
MSIRSSSTSRSSSRRRNADSISSGGQKSNQIRCSATHPPLSASPSSPIPNPQPSLPSCFPSPSVPHPHPLTLSHPLIPMLLHHIILGPKVVFTQIFHGY